MAVYTIIRVYQVPAHNRIEATDRMLEALALGVTDDFHVKDILREPDGKPGSGVQISLTPPKAWGTLLLDQLLGRSDKSSVERLFLLPIQTWGKVQISTSHRAPVGAPWPPV